MTNAKLMYSFILEVDNQGKTTEFLKQLFCYKELCDVNYIFRVSLNGKTVVMDVFDNISENRFNRYFFQFKKAKPNYLVNELNNIFVTTINVLSLNKTIFFENNLLKFAYLFKCRSSMTVNYAKTFLSDELTNILIAVINTNI